MGQSVLLCGISIQLPARLALRGEILRFKMAPGTVQRPVVAQVRGVGNICAPIAPDRVVVVALNPQVKLARCGCIVDQRAVVAIGRVKVIGVQPQEGRPGIALAELRKDLVQIPLARVDLRGQFHSVGKTPLEVSGDAALLVIVAPIQIAIAIAQRQIQLQRIEAVRLRHLDFAHDVDGCGTRSAHLNPDSMTAGRQDALDDKFPRWAWRDDLAQGGDARTACDAAARHSDGTAMYRNASARGGVIAVLHPVNKIPVIAAADGQGRGFVVPATGIVDAVHRHDVVALGYLHTDLTIGRNLVATQGLGAAPRVQVEDEHFATGHETRIVQRRLQRHRLAGAPARVIPFDLQIKPRRHVQPIILDPDIGPLQHFINAFDLTFQGRVIALDPVTVQRDDKAILRQRRQGCRAEEKSGGCEDTFHTHDPHCSRLIDRSISSR